MSMLLQMTNFIPFLYLTSISLCVCVYIYHHIFIPSSVDEHLGFFCSLAILNNVAVSIEVHLSFQISVFAFFRHRPRSGIVGSCGSAALSFWDATMLFSTVAAPIYIATNCVWGLSFRHILTNIWYLCSFWWLSFWQVWSDSSLWF